jgi:uncharacterized protein
LEKIMVEQFLHGVEITEITSGVRSIRTVKSSIIGLIGTAPDADDRAFPLNKPVLLTNHASEIAKLGKTGTIPMALTGIFAQVGAMVIVVRVALGRNEEATIANIVGGVDVQTGEYKGVQAFLSAESIVHAAPRILIAPGFTQQRLNKQASPVVASMLPIAERLRAVIIADGSNTNDQDVISWRKTQGSARVYVVDPWVKVFTDVESIVPPSPYVAGLIAKSDNEHGFWFSPSNQEIHSIVGTARPVDFSLGDPNCRANFLNENDVATIIQQNGYRLWGNRSCSSDQKWAFLSVRRTADLIHDSLLRAHLWAVDRNITRTYIDDVVESVNAYLAHLKALGAILGGECYPDLQLNTPANISQGKIFFDFNFTPPYPAERITFRSHLVNDYIKELF